MLGIQLAGSLSACMVALDSASWGSCVEEQGPGAVLKHLHEMQQGFALYQKKIRPS